MLSESQNHLVAFHTIQYVASYYSKTCLSVKLIITTTTTTTVATPSSLASAESRMVYPSVTGIYPGCRGKKAVKRLCVCVYVCVCYQLCQRLQLMAVFQ